MLYRYREVFSLRDEIGTCPNIEVQIDVTDKSPFLYGHIMLRKKIRHLLIKKMKCLCYMGILKVGFSAYFESSNVNKQKINQRQESGDRL